MHGISEGVKDSRHIQVHVVAVPPHISHWQRDELGECAIPVDPDPLGLRT